MESHVESAAMAMVDGRSEGIFCFVEQLKSPSALRWYIQIRLPTPYSSIINGNKIRCGVRGVTAEGALNLSLYNNRNGSRAPKLNNCTLRTKPLLVFIKAGEWVVEGVGAGVKGVI